MSINLDEDSFAFLQQFLRQHSGYDLQPDKRYLLESRVRKLLSEHRIASIPALVVQLAAQPKGVLAQEFLEVMTINETLFFRDARLFDTLVEQLIPEFLAMGKTRIHIWSAACSSGQEPYSIAMALEEARSQYPTLEYRILATDINQKVLDKASEGVFTEFELKRGLPARYAKKYFTPQGADWRIADSIKRHITFRRRNLQDSVVGIGPFEVVFLRNVLIYFDTELKEAILSRCWDVLSEGGALALGGTESIARLRHRFPRFADEAGYYRKKTA